VQFIPEGRGTRASGIVPAELALSQAQIDAFASAARTTILGVPIHDRIRVRWRPATGGDWNEVKDIVPRTRFDLFGGWNAVAPVAITQQRQATIRGQKTPVNALYELSINGVGTLPTHGQQIEIIVDYVGPVSEQWPFHFEGTWAEAVTHLLDGDWSYSDDPSAWSFGLNTTINPRIRYNATAVNAIDVPVRIRLTEPREDVREALEQCCAAVRAAPALNAAGEIAPIRWELPATDAVLAQIDDTNAVAIPGWEHPTDTAITAVVVTYERDFLVPQAEDPNGERSAGDGLASRQVTIRHRAPQGVLDVMGEQDVLKVDAWMLRALGGPTGQPVTADVRDEVGAQQAQQLAEAALDRSVYGQQSSFVRLMASDFPGLKPGDWVLDARSWAPNYATGKRGGNTLAQVVSIQRRHAWLDCRLVHSGPTDALLDPPTFGYFYEIDGVITVEVDAADEDVEVQYAINSTEPTANSGLWTFMGRRSGPGPLESQQFAVGTTVWLRGRSVGRGRRPSTWVGIGDITIAPVPRVRSLAARLQDDGTVFVEYSVNDATEGLRLYWQAHSADEDPNPVLFVDIDASGGTHVFSRATASHEMLTIVAEPYPTYSGGSVSGTPGDKVATTIRTLSEDLISLLRFDPVYKTFGGAQVTYRGYVGPLVQQVWITRARFEQLAGSIVADPYAYAEKNVLNLQIITSFTDDGEGGRYFDVVFTRPPEGFVDYVNARPYYVRPGGQYAWGHARAVDIPPLIEIQPIVDSDDHESVTKGYFFISIQLRGMPLTSITMGYQTSPSSIVDGLAPTRGPGQTSVVKGRTLADGEYEGEITLPQGWQSWIWFDLVFGNNYRTRVMSPPLGPNRTPAFIGIVPIVTGTTISIHADNARSVRVERKTGGTWQVDRDTTFPIGIDVSQEDDLGNPGLSSGSATYLCTIYSDPIAQRDGNTLTDQQTVTVTALGDTPTYSLLLMTAAPPPIDDSVATVTYKASSSTPEIVTRTRYRVNFGAWTNWTTQGSASPDPAPTTNTTYDLIGFPTRRLLTGQLDPPQYQVDVEVEGALVDGMTEHDTQVRSFSYTTNADDV